MLKWLREEQHVLQCHAMKNLLSEPLMQPVRGWQINKGLLQQLITSNFAGLYSEIHFFQHASYHFSQFWIKAAVNKMFHKLGEALAPLLSTRICCPVFQPTRTLWIHSNNNSLAIQLKVPKLLMNFLPLHTAPQKLIFVLAV